MLQDLILNLQSSLKSYSQGLAKQNLLVDIPWTMVDGDLNLQRLIFRKDNSLYIVKEGEIQESKWEYLPAMNSLVIEVGGKKILMNEVFADGKALILKRDGMAMDFLSFANQSELPDLDLVGYLEGLKPKQSKIEYSPKNEPFSDFKEEPFFSNSTEKTWFYLIVGLLIIVVILTINGILK